MNNSLTKYNKNFGLVLSILFCLCLITFFMIFSTQDIAKANGLSKVNRENSDLYNKLSQLDCVHDITPIETEKYKEKYSFEVTQPLDWNNPNLGTFNQRVVLSFNGYDKNNLIATEGYFLDEAIFSADKRAEITKHYSVNQINIEHRFFGKSIPDGLTDKDTKYWEYLTTENEAKDIHKIYLELSKILSNKWIATGASKNGETTMLYGYYFPNDMDVLVPYVAPWCVCNDKRAFDFIWNKAGDERYGKDQAKKYRQLMDDIMVDFYTHRDEVRDKFINERSKDIYFVDDTFGERTVKILYDDLVVDMVFGTWQYYQDFDTIQKVHNMSWDTQHNEKIEGLLNLISDSSTNVYLKNRMRQNNNEDIEYPFYAYQIQAREEEGNYYFDFSHLRELLKQNKISTGLEIAEGEEYDLLDKLNLHSNFLEKFKYTSKTHDNVINWWNSTNQKIMAIYGSSDPWYAMRINDIFDKENLKIYVSDNEAHNAKINNLEKSKSEEAWSILDKWLALQPVDPVNPANPEQNISETTMETTAQTSDETFKLILIISSLFLLSATIIFSTIKFQKNKVVSY